MPDRGDMIAIQDAVTEYGHTRAWWYEQVNAGHLNLYDIPGERRSFLSRTEIEAFIQPRKRPRPGEMRSTDETA